MPPRFQATTACYMAILNVLTGQLNCLFLAGGDHNSFHQPGQQKTVLGGYSQGRQNSSTQCNQNTLATEGLPIYGTVNIIQKGPSATREVLSPVNELQVHSIKSVLQMHASFFSINLSITKELARSDFMTL